ncbi:MAG: DNA polymerase III subunit [Pyrinomonadaceae bacterium]|nr:DNA polymerase III subunit [Pyrinomonadaceae bacterium]
MFNKLVGNAQIKTIFQRLLRAERLPNSLLFTGKNGVGKKLFALELAKAFVCQKPNNGEACDTCAACLRADKFSIPTNADKNDEFKKVFFSEHPDIGIVTAYKNNILIDAIRAVETESNFRPYEARARFFIIDEADKMNDAASNALLKTLEEPAQTSHIFLITSRPNSLLQTIRSRCQTVHFAPIFPNEIEDHLLQTKKFAPDDARLLSKITDGSIGRALDLDLGKFRERREIMLKTLESLIANQNRAILLRTAEELNDAKNKEFYGEYLEIFQTLIHDVWTLCFDENSEKIVNADLIPQLKRLSQNADKTRLSKWLKEIEVLQENFTVNLNKKIATDALFLQMAAH